MPCTIFAKSMSGLSSVVPMRARVMQVCAVEGQQLPVP